MSTTAESYGHAVILNIKGELTEDSLDAFIKVINHQLDKGKDIIDLVMNMENVPFIDSAAMEYLMDLQDRLADRLGQVKLVNCDENIRKILEITRLETTFEICSDITEAVKAI